MTLRNSPTAAPATGHHGDADQPDARSVDRGAAAARVPRPRARQVRRRHRAVPDRRPTASPPCSTTATLRLDLTADGRLRGLAHRSPCRSAIDSLFVPIAPFLDDIESGIRERLAPLRRTSTRTTGRTTPTATTPIGAIPGHSWFTAAPADRQGRLARAAGLHPLGDDGGELLAQLRHRGQLGRLPARAVARRRQDLDRRRRPHRTSATTTR